MAEAVATTLVPSTVAARATTLTGILVSAVDAETKVLQNIDAYASWLIALAAGGIGLVVTQSSAILDASLIRSVLSPTADKVLLPAAVFCFAVSGLCGATVKANVYLQIRMGLRSVTYYKFQLAQIEAGESAPLKDNSIRELHDGLHDGLFLGEKERADLTSILKSGADYSKAVGRYFPWQLCLVGVGYALLALVATF